MSKIMRTVTIHEPDKDENSFSAPFADLVESDDVLQHIAVLMTMGAEMTATQNEERRYVISLGGINPLGEEYHISYFLPRDPSEEK